MIALDVAEESMRLDDAVTWFFENWPHEGPRIPTKATVRTYRVYLKWFLTFATERGKLHVDDALQPNMVRAAMAGSAGCQSAVAVNVPHSRSHSRVEERRQKAHPRSGLSSPPSCR
jgi:hypothetical protein